MALRLSAFHGWLDFRTDRLVVGLPRAGNAAKALYSMVECGRFVGTGAAVDYARRDHDGVFAHFRPTHPSGVFFPARCSRYGFGRIGEPRMTMAAARPGEEGR